jgi:hypothetical protein
MCRSISAYASGRCGKPNSIRSILECRSAAALAGIADVAAGGVRRCQHCSGVPAAVLGTGVGARGGLIRLKREPLARRRCGHAASPRNLIAAVSTGSPRSSGAAAHVVRALSCEFPGFGGLGASALSFQQYLSLRVH